MGLDNGIIIKGKTLAGQDFVTEFFNEYDKEASSYPSGARDLAYWRKCWNVRHAILELPFAGQYDGQGGDVRMFISDLPDVVGVMKYFLDESHWIEGNGFINGSIWTWTEQLRNTAYVIWIITRLIEEIEDKKIEDADIDIFFYDSY